MKNYNLDLFKHCKPFNCFKTIIIDIRKSILDFDIDELKNLKFNGSKDPLSFEKMKIVIIVQNPLQTAYATMFKVELKETPLKVIIYS